MMNWAARPWERQRGNAPRRESMWQKLVDAEYTPLTRSARDPSRGAMPVIGAGNAPARSRQPESEVVMRPEELNLLLTVARVLRAQTRETLDHPGSAHEQDLWALNDALAPFEGIAGTPVNEERR